MNDEPGVERTARLVGEQRFPHSIHRPEDWDAYVADTGGSPLAMPHENGTPSLFSEPRFMAHADGVIEDRNPLELDCD